MTQFFSPLILVVNNVRKTIVKFLDGENILKPLFFVQNTRYFHVEIVPEIARPKCQMVYVCDVTVFDKQTNMAESEGKRLKHETGRKLTLLASKSLAHLKPCAREMTRRLLLTATLSNTVTSQTQFSSLLSRTLL